MKIKVKQRRLYKIPFCAFKALDKEWDKEGFQDIIKCSFVQGWFFRTACNERRSNNSMLFNICTVSTTFVPLLSCVFKEQKTFCIVKWFLNNTVNLNWLAQQLLCLVQFITTNFGNLSFLVKLESQPSYCCKYTACWQLQLPFLIRKLII